MDYRVLFQRFASIAFATLLLTACGGSADSGSSEETGNAQQVTELAIMDVSWRAANKQGSAATAMVQFEVTAGDPAGLENIQSVTVTSDTTLYTLYDAENDSAPKEIGTNQGLFFCDCWRYTPNHLNELALGDYVVTVTNKGGQKVTDTIEISNLEKTLFSGFIYTPEAEENSGLTPTMMHRPQLTNLAVDPEGIDVSLNLQDTRALSYELLYLNSDSEYIGGSALTDATGQALTTRFSDDTSYFIGDADFADIHQAYIFSYPTSVDDTNYAATHMAVSLTHIRDSYTATDPANSSPNAFFSYQPYLPQALTTVSFDASISSDSQDSDEALQFRWDWNNDGEYDTDFSASITQNYQFPSEGTYTVVMEVKDTGGLTDTYNRTISVSPAPIGDLYSLGFTPDLTLVNPTLNLVYMTDRQNKKVYAVNMSTGFIDGVISTSFIPQDLALSTDGQTLFIAELHAEFQYSRPVEEEATDIVTLNANTLEETARITVNLDVFDFFTTGTGEVYASGGSRFSTFIKAWHLADGSLINQVPIGDDHYLHPSADESSIYVSQSDYLVRHYSIDPDNGLGAYYDSTVIEGNINLGDQYYLTPDGQYLVTEKGVVFQLGDTEATDLIPRFRMWGDNTLIQSLTFDTEQNLFIVLTTSDHLLMFNATSFEYIDTIEHSMDSPEYVYHTADSIVLAGEENSDDILNVIEHPCLTCGDNTAPVAAINVSVPTGALTSDRLSFSASNSTDAESELLYRWDWDSDGYWDTPYDASPEISHRYVLADTYTPRVKVKDAGGLTATASLTLTVGYDAIPSDPLTEHAADDLPFDADFAYHDSDRQRLYLTDRDAGMLYFVSTQTGLVTQQYQLGFLPERMDVSQDNNTLYVVLATDLHRSSRAPAGTELYGYIAVVDLTTDMVTRMLRMDFDPFDVAATNSGLMFVSHGSDGSQAIRLMDADDGSLIARGDDIYFSVQSVLELHPDELRLYTNSLASSGDAQRHDLVNGNDVHATVNWGAAGSYSELFLSPQGDYIVTAGGDVMLTNPDPELDMQSIDGDISRFYVDHIAFDETENLIWTVDNNESDIPYYSATNYQLAGSITTNAQDPLFAFPEGNNILILDRVDDSVSIIRVEHPCIGCGDSTPPSIDVKVTPESGGTTLTNYILDASASSDTEDSTEQLQICWDWYNNDTCTNLNATFTSELTVEHSFSTAGTKFVNAIIKDSSGLTASTTLTINVGN